MTEATAKSKGPSAAGGVLLALCAGQFVMTLDSSVMNVSIATVAEDVGTTVTGIQTAITMYTLVMAMFMIIGGKIGMIIGRKRAFAIGCVIYGAGSFTTALSPTLGWLLFGWSFLEGIGAALILPAIVALVAGNFGVRERPRAYGLVSAAGAIAVAVGPLIGGLATTYASWRYVFVGEVLLIAVILLMARRIVDAPVEGKTKIDVVGAILSAAALGLAVFGILRSSTWGWVRPKSGAPQLIGLSMTILLIIAGLFLLWLFVMWERRCERVGKQPLVHLDMFENRQLRGGLVMFLSQYLLQMGLFFTVPLFLSVALGLSAIDTGLRILPLSITLLLAAAGIPKRFPNASPRRVVRIGILCLFAGIVSLMLALDADAGAEIVTVPLLFAGFGIGALASQLGSITVSSVSDDAAPEVGGLQNTATNLGASIGTALAGSIMIAVLTSSVLAGLSASPEISDEVARQATVELSAGVPFVSDAQIEAAAQEAGVSEDVTQAVVQVNEQARVDGLRAALAVLALIALVALFPTSRIPTVQPSKSAPAPG